MASQRELSALLNRGKLPPAVITQLVGHALAKGLKVTPCPHCPRHGPRIHDRERGTARCLACGRSERV